MIRSHKAQFGTFYPSEFKLKEYNTKFHTSLKRKELQKT